MSSLRHSLYRVPKACAACGFPGHVQVTEREGLLDTETVLPVVSLQIMHCFAYTFLSSKLVAL